MRTRKQPYGNKNLVGQHIEQLRKNRNIKQKDLIMQLQQFGIDMNASSLSKLEGQIRFVSDFELVALSNVFGVTIDELLQNNQ